MTDIDFLRETLAIASQSLEKGNLPFGCLLSDSAGNVLAKGENTVITDEDSIAHCEINLVHQLAGKYNPESLINCTLYASTEPCPMCASAIFWSGIGRIVFAISKESYHSIAGTANPAHVFDMSSKQLLSHGGRQIKVEGPLLEEETIAFYKNIYRQ